MWNDEGANKKPKVHWKKKSGTGTKSQSNASHSKFSEENIL